MKFAGPSMGAALGSGLMQGYSSAQELQAKEELARDTSAMATYSKLVSSGEWEPVGKEGVKDGGVLRVGNVGFLKKVERPQGMDLKSLNYESLINSRKSAAELAREKFEWEKNKPAKMVTVQELSTGRRKSIPADAQIPEGYYKIGVVNAPGMAATESRFETGLDVSGIDKRIADLDRKISSRKDWKLFKSPTGAVKKGLEEMQEWETERDKLLEMRKQAFRSRSGAPVDGPALGPVKRVGELPPPEIIPTETWRKVAAEQRLDPAVGDRAKQLVQEDGMVSKLLDAGVASMQDVIKWAKELWNKEKQTGPPLVRGKVPSRNSVRKKITSVPDFVTK